MKELKSELKLADDFTQMVCSECGKNDIIYYDDHTEREPKLLCEHCYKKIHKDLLK